MFLSFLVPRNLTSIWIVDYELLQLSSSFQGPQVLHVVAGSPWSHCTQPKKVLWREVAVGAALWAVELWRGLGRERASSPCPNSHTEGIRLPRNAQAGFRPDLPSAQPACAGHSLPAMRGCPEDRQEEVSTLSQQHLSQVKPLGL